MSTYNESNHKITKAMMFQAIYDVIDSASVDNKDDLLNFLNHEMELNKKRNKRTESPKEKEQKLAEENEILKHASDFTEPFSAGEILKSTHFTSPQKIAAILKRLVDKGKVAGIVSKKGTKYKFM